MTRLYVWKAAGYMQLADCNGEWFPVGALRAYDPDGPDRMPAVEKDRVTESVIRYVQRLAMPPTPPHAPVRSPCNANTALATLESSLSSLVDSSFDS